MSSEIDHSLTTSVLPDAETEQLQLRLKKLESQLKAQQTRNARYREQAEETFRSVRSAILSLEDDVADELEEFKAAVIDFCERRSNRNLDAMRLSSLLLRAYQAISREPQVPNWLYRHPPRPWTPEPQKQAVQNEFEEELSTERDEFEREERMFAEEEARLWRGGEIQPETSSEVFHQLRAVYIRLARAVHPDKFKEHSQREAATAFMKRVNAAYSRRDGKALFDLEKELKSSALSVPEGKSSRANEISARIAILTEQLSQLKDEMKQLRETQRGRILKSFEKVKKSGISIVEFAAPHLPQLKREMREIAIRLSALNRNEVTQRDFLDWFERRYPPSFIDI